MDTTVRHEKLLDYDFTAKVRSNHTDYRSKKFTYFLVRFALQVTNTATLKNQ